MFDEILARFRQVAPKSGRLSIRIERRREEVLRSERGTFRPRHTSDSFGAMITAQDRGGLGYAATSDLSLTGLAEAVSRAVHLAQAAAAHMVPGFPGPLPAPASARYESANREPWRDIALSTKLGWLDAASRQLKVDERIADWGAQFWAIEKDQLYADLDGGVLEQRFHYLMPGLWAAASAQGETQRRSFGDAGMQLGGAEILSRSGFFDAPARIGSEAIALIEAPNCPEGTMDLVLSPDQMVLQIHESIGHPLELDRILGDERNYAGTSFVTPDMFGHFRYGSDLLNITFDPTEATEIASYAFDDEGTKATREYLIKDGILMRPLGGATSQARANLPGVANARACSWNRPAIDRMANINLEPGMGSLADLIGAVERGVYMEANKSWSIDDSRNKFQFGCEYAREIKDGALGRVVRNPNYRGVSSAFWRSLAGVGGRETYEVAGTPYCGKGEPNQAIKVGHATPACRFTGVAVFGGA